MDRKKPPDASDADISDRKNPPPGLIRVAADAFILTSSVVYAMAALTMSVVSICLIFVSGMRVLSAMLSPEARESMLLDAVSSLVISVAILDVAKHVMDEEVLHSRELRNPREAREAVTKFMVIIALVVAIEGIVLVFEVGRARPDLLLFPILLLWVSVIVVIEAAFSSA